MDLRKIHLLLQKGIERQPLGGAQGFALVTLLAITPLLMACTTGVGLTYFVLKRKSLAQSLCVNSAAKTQKELRVPLEKLLRMNPQAKTLRARRSQADLRLQQALMSGNPGAISAARLAQQVVILQQTAFHTKQIALFTDAARIRSQNERELRQRTTGLPALDFAAPRTGQSLALEPRPFNSPSPDYFPVLGFESLQQQHFHFTIDVFREFPFLKNLKINPNQRTECSVTLKERNGEWGIQILAAKAP